MPYMPHFAIQKIRYVFYTEIVAPSVSMEAIFYLLRVTTSRTLRILDSHNSLSGTMDLLCVFIDLNEMHSIIFRPEI